MLKLYEKLNYKFSAEEKEACLPLVGRFIEMNNKMRKDSYLSLENDIYNMNEEKDFFLKTALHYPLVFWGNDMQEFEELLEDMLSNLIIADGSTGAELLSRLIIIQGIISIVRAESPMLLCHRLLCMLGQEYLKNADDYFK